MAPGRRIGAVVSGTVMAVLVVLLSLTSLSQRMDHRYGLGLLFDLRGPLPAPAGAIVVAIDKQSIGWLRDLAQARAPVGGSLAACLPGRAREELGRLREPSALPRALHACLLEELTRLGFSAVAFDILFAVAGVEEEDRMLAQALERHGAAVILIGLERSVVEEGGAELLVEREIQPISLLRDSAAAAGAFLVTRAGGPAYGYWRRVPGFEGTGSLPEQTLRLTNTKDASVIAPDDDASDLAYIWHYGPPGSIRTVALSAILSGEFPEDIRATASESVAFIGAADPRTTDYIDSFPSYFRARIDSGVSGVELAATAYLNLRNGHDLRRLSIGTEALLIAVAAFVLGLIARASSGIALLAIPGFAIAYLAVATLAFVEMRLFLPIAAPVFIAAPICFVLAVLLRYRVARRLITRLAPAPEARRMLAESTGHRGLAVTEDVTVAFYDIIGSTTIAETLSDLDFSALLNTYFDTVTREIERNHGFVAAFTGDGVTAIFPSSEAGPEHAARACRAAVSSVRTMREVNRENMKRDLPPLGMRIGLNSGPVAAGEIGARDRFNFSVVGDVVNLAARLEQLGKTLFPGERDVILIGSRTHDLVDGQEFQIAGCGSRPIPGRKTEETIFRVLID